MSGRLLSPEDRAHFLKAMRRQMNSAVHRRMNVLLLLGDGWTVAAIAGALYLSESTISEHRTLYLERGRKGVETLLYVGRRCALDDDELSVLASWIEASVPQTCAEVTTFVRARFAVAYTPHALARLLGRLDFVYRKPKCVPAKAGAAVQQAFLDTCLKPLMQAAGPQAPLSFVDATHPSYTGRPAYGWLRKGKTVELKSNHGRTRLHINGALSWPQRQLVHRQEELITSAAMIRLFEDLCVRHPGAAKITVVLDNARYNRSRELREWLSRSGNRIEPVYLPPYTPNLNLIERFWHFMKRKVLFNKAYPTFALFEQAFQQFFRSLPDYADQMASRITDKFHLIGRQGSGIPSA